MDYTGPQTCIDSQIRFGVTSTGAVFYVIQLNYKSIGLFRSFILLEILIYFVTFKTKI